MNIEFKIQSLCENISVLSSTAFRIIKDIRERNKDDDRISHMLSCLIEDINRHESLLKGELTVNKDEYNTISFLKEALCQEYKSIYGYQIYADSTDDTQLKEMLIRFGAMELKHAELLSNKIMSLGGTCEFFIKDPVQPKKLTIEDMLKEHKRGEEKAITLFEKGLKHITDPELNWFIGRLKMDETEHLKEIEVMLKECRCLSKILSVSESVKWHDDYAGDDKDRPWIDG